MFQSKDSLLGSDRRSKTLVSPSSFDRSRGVNPEFVRNMGVKGILRGVGVGMDRVRSGLRRSLDGKSERNQTSPPVDPRSPRTGRFGRRRSPMDNGVNVSRDPGGQRLGQSTRYHFESDDE